MKSGSTTLKHGAPRWHLRLCTKCTTRGMKISTGRNACRRRGQSLQKMQAPVQCVPGFCAHPHCPTARGGATHRRPPRQSPWNATPCRHQPCPSMFLRVRRHLQPSGGRSLRIPTPLSLLASSVSQHQQTRSCRVRSSKRRASARQMFSAPLRFARNGWPCATVASSHFQGESGGCEWHALLPCRSTFRWRAAINEASGAWTIC
mmetsp:Transcript_18024/g.54276  ORF Transcript_18024/g.54276 Transcript_18024/m.54276 type:complete len:204 (+) Transcript_18024:764-1375(+)